jgi:hypothetical protein
MSAAPPGEPNSESASGGGNRGAAGMLGGVGLSVVLHTLLLPLGLVVGLVLCAIDAATRSSAGPQLALCLTIGIGAVLVFIGVSQLVYMIPAVLIARRRGRVALAQGLALGAALTFLLNAGCWGLIGMGGGMF